jgi:predicted KAP-like P-loop ATPase
MLRDTAFGNPAVHPDEDEFNRWPFGRALADRIAGLGNAEGAAVIGLYGKWGSGKSTVLNFIKYRLKHEHASKVVLFEFNPWFFTSQEQLLAAFFTGLASRLEQSLGSPVKDAGALLKKYSGLFGMIPVVGSGATSRYGQYGPKGPPQ